MEEELLAGLWRRRPWQVCGLKLLAGVWRKHFYVWREHCWRVCGPGIAGGCVEEALLAVVWRRDWVCGEGLLAMVSGDGCVE